MANHNYKVIINRSARIAAGVGIPGSFFPPLDIVGMSIVWIKLTLDIAKESKHQFNWFLATKLIYSIIAGSILYIGGSKLINSLLHAIPGAGNITAAGANSVFNYIYTNRLGNLLVLQFDTPNFTQRGIFSMAKTIAIGVFANVTADEVSTAFTDVNNSTEVLASNFDYSHAFSDTFTAAISSAPFISHEFVTSWVNTITQTAQHPFIPVFQQYAENINARISFAFTPQWGDELICYNPKFLDIQYYKYGSDAVIGILAHEVGHSVMGSSLLIHNWSNEMNADYFAGAMLAKLKLNITGFLNSLSESGKGSLTHPDGNTRIFYALKGFLDGGGNLNN